MAPNTTLKVMIDHQAGGFFPGQTIKGYIEVTNKKQTQCEGISAKFEGFAHVRFRETGVDWNDEGWRKWKKRTYVGNEDYYSKQYSLWPDGSQDLKRGTFRFPIAFVLPELAPASYACRNGRIVHYCEATLKRANVAKDLVCKEVYTVSSVLDLNVDPSNKEPQERMGSASMCSLWSGGGLVSARVRLDKKGYVPGERVLVTAQVNNNTNMKITSTKAEIFMTVLLMTLGKNRKETYALTQLVQPEIPIGGTYEWTGQKLFVPPLTPSGPKDCNIIDITYTLKFSVESLMPCSTLVLDIPINIGTIPLRLPPDHAPSSTSSVLSAAQLISNTRSAEPSINNNRDTSPPSYAESTYPTEKGVR